MSDDPLALCLAGRLSAPVAMARLVLAGVPAETVAARLRAMRAEPPAPAWIALAGLAGCGDDPRLRAIARASDHDAAAPDVGAIGAFFDGALRQSAEASVAFYSLGDPALLGRATAELVDWLARHDLIRGDVLDLGTGIGRVAAALAPRCRSVLGLDVAPGMVAEASRRGAGHPNLRFALTGGTDLAGLAPDSLDLVLAVDSFPYIVQLGAAVADRHVADAARALRPGGTIAIANLSYRADRERRDPADAARWAGRHGLVADEVAGRPFTLWDGLAFRLRRP